MIDFAAIAKWTAIAAFIAMIGVVFNAFSDQGKLEEALKSQEAQLARSNAEIVTANESVLTLQKVNKEQADGFKRKAEASIKYKRRALYAERELAKIVSNGDIVAINYSLCEAYDRIEGNDSDGREERCNAYSQTSDASSIYYKVGEQSLQNLLANGERIAATIDQCFIEVNDGS